MFQLNPFFREKTCKAKFCNQNTSSYYRKKVEDLEKFKVWKKRATDLKNVHSNNGVLVGSPLLLWYLSLVSSQFATRTTSLACLARNGQGAV